MHAPTAVKIASLAVLVGCAAPHALQPTGLLAQAATVSLAGDVESTKQVGVAGNCPADTGPMRPASADAMVDRNGDGYVCTQLIRSIAGDTLRLTVDNDSAQVETVLPEPYIGM